MDISTTSGRNFAGVVSLKEGYGSDGLVHTREEVIETWRTWATERHANKEPWVGALVGQIENLLYAFEESSDGLKLYNEPVVTISGEIASYQEHLDDQTITQVLVSLFAALGSRLKQTTVRFTYHGHNSRVSYRIRMPETIHPLDSLN